MLMFSTIEQFKEEWEAQSEYTRKLFSVLTDESLEQSISTDHRNLGRMAWHIVQSIVEMAGRTGLKIDGPTEDMPVPESAEALYRAYNAASQSLLEQVINNWTNETLAIEDDMYGKKWERGLSLYILLSHETHHRAQMTVLMRQAALKIPGYYGPSKEEWAEYGGKAPAI